ncbi:MAG: hypothetical protein ACRD2L_04895 [Terriglobia bacterium]
MTESLKEQIKHETELLRLLWITALATLGGSLSLLLGELTSLRVGLAGLGFLVTLGLIVMVLLQENTIRALIRQIKEKEK